MLRPKFRWVPKSGGKSGGTRFSTRFCNKNPLVVLQTYLRNVYTQCFSENAPCRSARRHRACRRLAPSSAVVGRVGGCISIEARRGKKNQAQLSIFYPFEVCNSEVGCRHVTAQHSGDSTSPRSLDLSTFQSPIRNTQGRRMVTKSIFAPRFHSVAISTKRN